jgi:hypothetical protein
MYTFPLIEGWTEQVEKVDVMTHGTKHLPLTRTWMDGISVRMSREELSQRIVCWVEG